MRRDNEWITGCHANRYFNWVVTLTLSFLVTFQPLLPAINYAMAKDLSISQGAREGQDLWNDLEPGMKYPDTNGGTEIATPDGEKMSMSELFQAKSQDDSYTSMYAGGEKAFEEQGREGRRRLVENKDSSEGKAYRTLRESAYQSKPDLKNDPIWGSTDSVYDFLDGKQVNCTGEDNHTPQYRTCTRVNLDAQGCNFDHDYDIGVFEHVSGPANLASCGEGCMDFWLGKIGDNYYPGNCTIYEEAMKIRMLNPDAITSARLTYAKWDDYMQVWISDNKVWSGPNGLFPPETNGKCELSTSWERNPNTNLTAQFKNRKRDEVVDLKIRTSVSGDGEGYAKIRIYYDPNKIVINDEWDGSDACAKKAQIYQARYGDSGATCTQMPHLNKNGCFADNGVTACKDLIKPSPIEGVSPFCESVRVSAPASLRAKNTCDALESNPSCGFITSTCDGSTPREMIEDLYRTGLGREPDASGMNYWLNYFQENGQDFEELRNAFFDEAGYKNEDIINSFSCNTFKDTYDCGYDKSSNAGACAVQDLFQNDFADCTENLVPKEITENIDLKQLDTCEEALELTECTVERQLSSASRSGSAKWSRGCFISDSVSYRLPWADKALSGHVSISTSGNHTSASITQQPSVSNNWTAKVGLNGSGKMVDKVRKVERACEENEDGPKCYDEYPYQELECPDGSSLSVNLSATGSELTMHEDEDPAEEGNSPCLRSTDNWTDTEWVCQETTSLNIGGVPTSMTALTAAIDPMYQGAPANCVKGHVAYHTKEYGQGDYCWTDMDGKYHCEDINSSKGIDVGNDSCSALEARANTGECKYLGRFPVEGGAGSKGYQYVWEHRYDCTTEEHQVTRTEMTPQYTCEGIVKCMGTECMTPNRETSQDFDKAVSMLQALQQIGQDITCDVNAGNDLQNCRVFGGEAQTCKQALGGYVDCCETPSGVSIGDYITMIKATAKMDNFIMNTDSMSAIKGSYASLRDPVVDSVNYMKSAFTEQFDNISGSLLGDGGSGVGGSVDAISTAIEGFKQTIMKSANQFLVDNFGQNVASMFFEQGAGSTVQLTGAVSGALSVIGTIYTIYTVAKIVINIIWKCSEDELSLGVDRRLKKTHYVGSYCHTDSMFGCLEKRRSYCVFSAPLPRIINEQARPQLGRGWGSAKQPDCSGITLAELNRLDWNKIDLKEWTDLLKITGNMPDQQAMDIESLTGNGSYLGERAASQGETRLNTADRNVERLQGTDLHEIKHDASTELWQSQ